VKKNSGSDDIVDLWWEDEKGFAVPKSPSHSLQLLNRHMRTNLLLHVHRDVRTAMESDPKKSPLHHLARSLERIVREARAGVKVETVTKNPMHVDPHREFDSAEDCAHDLNLMKHHLRCHKKTIDEIRRWKSGG